MSNDDYAPPAFTVDDLITDGQCNVYGHDMVDGGCTYCGVENVTSR